jgi:hypothetical protein
VNEKEAVCCQEIKNVRSRIYNSEWWYVLVSIYLLSDLELLAQIDLHLLWSLSYFFFLYRLHHSKGRLCNSLFEPCCSTQLPCLSQSCQRRQLGHCAYYKSVSSKHSLAGNVANSLLLDYIISKYIFFFYILQIVQMGRLSPVYLVGAWFPRKS